MQEIVKLVSEKTGIPEAQAKIAVETVIALLKQKLPAPLAAQVDSVIAGGATPDLGDLAAGALGGLFGKK
jgi:hypothetical protein